MTFASHHLLKPAFLCGMLHAEGTVRACMLALWRGAYEVVFGRKAIIIKQNGVEGLWEVRTECESYGSCRTSRKVFEGSM